MYIDNSCHVHAHIVKVINVYEYLVVFANKFACDQDNLRKTSQSLIGIEPVYIPIAMQWDALPFELHGLRWSGNVAKSTSLC